MTNNTWYHIAGTFDGRYARLYIDGNLVGTHDFGGGTNVYYHYPNNLLLIGADATATSTAQGFYFNA